MQSPPILTADSVSEALATVYARPELAPREPPWLLRWLGELVARIRDLFPQVRLGEDGGSMLAWIVGGWLALSALVILGYLLLSAAGMWRGRRQRTARGQGIGDRGQAVERPSAAGWETVARQAALVGRFREAALALYQALLLRLESRGTVRYDPAKTPGDYRRETRRDPDSHRALDGFLRSWEPAIFGGRPIDREIYERLKGTAAEAGVHG